MRKIAQISLIISMSPALGNSPDRNYFFHSADNDWIEVSREKLKSSLKKQPAKLKKQKIMSEEPVYNENECENYVFKEMIRLKKHTNTPDERSCFIKLACVHFAQIGSWKNFYEKPTIALSDKAPKIRFDDKKNTIAEASRYIKNMDTDLDSCVSHSDDIKDTLYSAIMLPRRPIDERKEEGYEVVKPHDISSIPSASNGTESKLYSIIGWFFKK